MSIFRAVGAVGAIGGADAGVPGVFAKGVDDFFKLAFERFVQNAAVDKTGQDVYCIFSCHNDSP